MTEDEARSRVSALVPRETVQTMAAFVEMVRNEAASQNLVAHSTLKAMWSRHVLDSVQLLECLPCVPTRWTDVGTGAGFPGLVIAIATGCSMTLIESRRLRTAFLQLAVDQLDLANVTVLTARAEAVSTAPAEILSARAVAPLTKLFVAMQHLANNDTIWLLPKGRNAASELADARRTWQGDFVMRPSLTDPDASILVARHVQPRKERGR